MRYHVPTYAVRKSDRLKAIAFVIKAAHVHLRFRSVIQASGPAYRYHRLRPYPPSFPAYFNLSQARVAIHQFSNGASCFILAEQYPDHHSHGFCLPSPELVLAQYPLYSGISIDRHGHGKAVRIKLKRRVLVVAPIKVMVPSSICGRNASCWLLLKR